MPSGTPWLVPPQTPCPRRQPSRSCPQPAATPNHTGRAFSAPATPLEAVRRTRELMKRKLIPGPAATTGWSQSWGCFSVCLFFCCFVFPGKNSHQINLKQSLTVFFLTFPLLQPCHLKPSKQNSMRQTPASQLLMPTAIA